MSSQAMRVERSTRVRDERPTIVGTLAAIDAQGRPLVRFAGSGPRPVVARVATSVPRPADAELKKAPSVLLAFEDERPVIVGFVQDTFRAAEPAGVAETLSSPGRAVEVNGRTIVIEGQDELVLRCGQGSITIRADGHIVVKGTRLISRASETNKIRGASVQIN